MPEPLHEITLSDLLAWEPQFEWAGEPPIGWRNRDVSWAVITRASAPMLPPLHGGEVVIMPRGGLEASGASFGTLLRELAPHDPAAVLIEPATAACGTVVTADLALLTLPGVALTPELESRLNRLLAERRGGLYRTGTELGRALTALAGREPDVARVVQVAAEATALPLRVVDRLGQVAARSPRAAEVEPVSDGLSVERLLADGHRLAIGPVAAEMHAAARLVADRIVAALNDVVQRAADLRPRGAGRADALASLLESRDASTRSDFEALGRQLGLDGAATYRVALALGDASTAPPDCLRAAGTVQSAGRIAGANAYLLECRDRNGGIGPIASRATEPATAISGPVVGVAALPEATRQARFTLALLAGGSLAGPVAQFDRADDLHAYRLLYELWGSAAAERFARDVLGELRRRDRRGELRKTLLVFLGAGGSHVEAARRLGIHRNTLAYRLRQIDRALGRDFREGDDALGLHLALLVDTMPSFDADGGRRSNEPNDA